MSQTYYDKNDLW